MTGNERETSRVGVVGWVAASLALVLSAGCGLRYDKVGVGEHCRRQSDCLSGLICVDRVCEAPPQDGKPTSVPNPVATPDASTGASMPASDAGSSDAGDGG